MRTWERVRRAMMCGACGEVLGEGQMVQLVNVTGTKRKLLRCEHCADGPAPVDVPPLPSDYERGRATKPMKSLSPLLKHAERTYRPPYKND